MRTSHWSDVTTGEVGSMVREAIKRGEAAMVKEAQEKWCGTSECGINEKMP